VIGFYRLTNRFLAASSAESIKFYLELIAMNAGQNRLGMQ